MKWLVMLYNYPFAFLDLKKDLKQFHLSTEEKENIEWIRIKKGEIN